MGAGRSAIDEETLNTYQHCTYFTKRKIRHLYTRFSALNPDKISPIEADTVTRLSFAEVQSLPELKVNPFRERICKVFSTNGQGINFEDFLDMSSVFSESADWELKVCYAFKIYDWNEDFHLCHDDIKEIITAITGGHLASEEIDQVVKKVMEEFDFNKDKPLSYADFEHVISKAPEFVNLFMITF